MGLKMSEYDVIGDMLANQVNYLVSVIESHKNDLDDLDIQLRALEAQSKGIERIINQKQAHIGSLEVLCMEASKRLSAWLKQGT